MPALKDLTNMVFGRLTALRCVGVKNSHAIWLVRCSCDGKEKEVMSGSLVSGLTQSCGCLHRELARVQRVDLTNQVFGRLKVIGPAPDKLGHGRVYTMWEVECSCPAKTRKVVAGMSLVAGLSSSCGCKIVEIRKSYVGQNNPGYKHGHSPHSTRSRTLSSWYAMIARCTQPSHNRWSRYGGAGIKVCERWLNSFAAFLEDMGERPVGTSLGRFGDVGNYEKSNCAWQTPKEQGATQHSRRFSAILAA